MNYLRYLKFGLQTDRCGRGQNHRPETCNPACELRTIQKEVPGPDGKYGYGGKCFPKDVNAFAAMTKGTPMGVLLEHLHELNVHFRGVEEKI